jgi:uncharacterized damage-inducible protein DinB
MFEIKDTIKLFSAAEASRRLLLDFCEQLPFSKFTEDVKACGWGSIRNLLVHMAETQAYWLHAILQGRPHEEWDVDQLRDVATIRAKWAETQKTTYDLLAAKDNAWLNTPNEFVLPWDPGKAEMFAPWWAIVHVITHEFHHKGQVVMVARGLGYDPPETDLPFPRAW